MQVADGVHRLAPGVCNCYLVEGAGKLALVDAGAPRDWDLLARTLASMGHRLEDLDAVLLTHAHRDHTGFAERARSTAEVSTFADGEVLGVPGRPRVVHAPGHTPGCAALLLEGRRVLLSGDVLVPRNPLTGRVGPQVMPSGFNRDTPQALRSLHVLDGIAADVLLPGHGEPWTEGAAEAARLARAAGRS